MNQPIYTPRAGDKVLCDPTFTKDDLDDGRKPNCVIPAYVIEPTRYGAHVEIVDLRDPVTNKRDFTNTDAHGARSYILSPAIIPHP